MSEEDNIGKKIKERLENHEFPVSGDVWKSIHQHLPTPDTGFVQAPAESLLGKAAYSFSIFSYASVAISLVASLLLVTSVVTRNATPTESVHQVEAPKEQAKGTDSENTEVIPAPIPDDSAFADASNGHTDSTTRLSEQSTADESTIAERTATEPVLPAQPTEKSNTSTVKEYSAKENAPLPEQSTVTSSEKTKQPSISTPDITETPAGMGKEEKRPSVASYPANAGFQDKKKMLSTKPRRPLSAPQKQVSTHEGSHRPINDTTDYRSISGESVYSAKPEKETIDNQSELLPLEPRQPQLFTDTTPILSGAAEKSLLSKATTPSTDTLGKASSTTIDTPKSGIAGKPNEGDNTNIVIPGLSLRQRFSVDMLLQPRYTFSNSDVRAGHSSKEPIWNKTEKGATHFAASILLNMTLSKKFTVSSGVSYESLGKIVHYNYTVSTIINQNILIYGWRPSPNPGRDSVYIPIDTITRSQVLRKTIKVKETPRASYIGIPLSATIHWSKNRWQGFVTMGGQVNLLQYTEHQATHTDSLRSYQAPSLLGNANNAYRKVVPVVFVSAGATYQISDLVSLIMAPRFQYTLSPIHTKGYAESQHFYSVGMAIGIRIRINNFPSIPIRKF